MFTFSAGCWVTSETLLRAIFILVISLLKSSCIFVTRPIICKNWLLNDVVSSSGFEVVALGTCGGGEVGGLAGCSSLNDTALDLGLLAGGSCSS